MIFSNEKFTICYSLPQAHPLSLSLLIIGEVNNWDEGDQIIFSFHISTS